MRAKTTPADLSASTSATPSFTAFTLPSIGIALAMAVIVAALLNPYFITPFPVMLGRMLVIAMLLLIAFAAAGRWHPWGLPRWLVQVLAVVVTAPLATLLVYLPTIGFMTERFRHEPFLLGYLFITGATLLVAPVLALGSLYRERDAQARAASLAFELERSNLERQALDARLKLLHAQVEPHFLFNTLANVQALVESGSPRAASVLTSLIAYLRAAMPSLQEGGATLGAELALVRAYLELMQMRMPDRLRYSIEVDDDLVPLRFPPMALLTLIENAVRHGIDPSEAGGTIAVRAWRDAGGEVRVVATDSGVGMSETAVPGTGLANLRERLQAFFGVDASLELNEVMPHGVSAAIVFRPAPGARA